MKELDDGVLMEVTSPSGRRLYINEAINTSNRLPECIVKDKLKILHIQGKIVKDWMKKERTYLDGKDVCSRLGKR